MVALDWLELNGQQGLLLLRAGLGEGVFKPLFAGGDRRIQNTIANLKSTGAAASRAGAVPERSRQSGVRRGRRAVGRGGPSAAPSPAVVVGAGARPQRATDLCARGQPPRAVGLAIRTAGPIITIERRLNRASDENVRADMTALPVMLGRVEELIAAGTLGGGALNAADYQIATSVRLLMCFDDLRPLIERRPAGP